MLEFFFRHYESWVDRFFIYDDGSTDETLDYLAAKENTVVTPFERADPSSLILSGVALSNSVWKNSIGQADWVIVIDLDEHLTHPDMRAYLCEQYANGVTAIPALGYQMVSFKRPASGEFLARDYLMGAPWQQMSKLGPFRPEKITETNFSPGRHEARLEGEVLFPAKDEMINLHYKYMGLKETHDRHLSASERLCGQDKVNNWGHKYAWSQEELEADFEAFHRASIDVSKVDHHTFNRERRWWRAPSI